jgi:hypothetical protein
LQVLAAALGRLLFTAMQEGVDCRSAASTTSYL